MIVSSVRYVPLRRDQPPLVLRIDGAADRQHVVHGSGSGRLVALDHDVVALAVLEPAELPLAQPPGGVREHDHDQEERDPPPAHQEAEGSHPTRLVGRAERPDPTGGQPART